MTTRQQRLAVRGRRLETVAAAVTVLVAATLCAAVPAPEGDDGRTRASGSERAQLSRGVSRPHAVDTRAPLPEPDVVPRSVPTRVSIPQISTDIEVFPAGPEKDGTPPTPDEKDAHRAAWYKDGPAPGEQGPALLVGHLDTKEGPAAFAGLGSLKPGSEVRIEREDGADVVFTVDSVEQYQKDNFPNERVYGPTRTPQLRLITCAGNWTKENSYDANIVAFASLRPSESAASPES